MTLSVLVLDREADMLGVAVATHPLAVGSRVPSLRPGVGVAVTQGMTDAALARRVLQVCAEGEPEPERALRHVLHSDPGRPWRQVAVLTAEGRGAIHTGEYSFGAICAHIAAGVIVVGNMLRGVQAGEVVQEVFASSSGSTAQRLIGALEAADAVGGDRRGATSAALLVGPASQPTADDLIDLRVDSHPDPITELSRLLAERSTHTAAGRLMYAVTGLGAEVSLSEVGAMLEQVDPSSRYAMDVRFWAGAALARQGDHHAYRYLKDAVTADACWADMLGQLDSRGAFPAAVAHEIATLTSTCPPS